MVHLVTGYKGSAHITSADQGAFNAGIVGSGEYVMNAGNKFAASVISSNTVRILDGDLLMQGRHVRLAKDTYEEVTINNGLNAMNRNDIIVARYTKDSSTGVENVAFAVVQGVSTSGTASDPELTTGDILSGNCLLHEMPLWRIPLTGLTVGTPVQLFELSDTMSDIADKVKNLKLTADNVSYSGTVDADNVNGAIDMVYENFGTAANVIGDAIVALGVDVPEGTSLLDMAPIIEEQLYKRTITETQSGNFKMYVNSGASSFTSVVTFPTPFQGVPNVSVSCGGGTATVLDVTTGGFTAKLSGSWTNVASYGHDYYWTAVYVRD